MTIQNELVRQRDMSLESQSFENDGNWDKLFKLSASGVTPEQRANTLITYQKYMWAQRSNFLGYQAGQTLDYKDDLDWMLGFHINNIGDPFKEGNFTLNSKAAERAVLDYYAKLWHAKVPHDPNDPESYWGYILTMGSTEGNMYGMWNARDYLSGKALIPQQRSKDGKSKLMWAQARATDGFKKKGLDANMFTPIAFYSEDTHYSLTKIMRVLGIQTFYEVGNAKYAGDNPLGKGNPWPEEVPSLPGPSGSSIDGPGEIDIGKLQKLVKFFADKGHPILMCLNYGTTFKGAYDRVADVIEMLKETIPPWLFEREIECEGRMEKRYGFWVHVDGALGAAYMPFLKMAQNDPNHPFKGDISIPEFDFSLKYVFSISMSGHKWIGAPWPCGVFMTKVKYQLRPSSIPIYVGSPDTTFAGSRSGYSPMILWDYLAKHSYSEQIDLAYSSQRLAIYAEEQLKILGQKLGIDLLVARTPLAITVRFRQPIEKWIKKYSLSTEEFSDDPQKRKYAHIFLMPGIDSTKIDQLITDLSTPGAFDLGKPQDRADLLQTVPETATFVDSTCHLMLVPDEGRGFK